MDDLSRIKYLRREIERHNQLYYNAARPEISDSQYDALAHELKLLEQRHPQHIEASSPTRNVGARPNSALARGAHFRPMLSLDSSADPQQAEAFLAALPAGCPLLAQPKMDGLSVELTYENGVLVRGLTRGDGKTGENVTNNLRTIADIPQQLNQPFPAFLVARGEVYMSLADFEALNKKLINNGQEPFANPRNAAAGGLRQLDPAITASRRLSFFVFELVNALELGFVDDYNSLLELRRLGFILHDQYQLKRDIGREFAENMYQYYLSQRESLGFEIDGMVLKVDDFALREEMGWRSRSPRWAFAWKFPPRQQVTRVEDIMVQVGRTGKLTPVALLRPVDVGGVTISRASLHNFGELARLNLAVGDMARLERAGDVIPKVVRVEEKGAGQTLPPPHNCPVCDSLVMEKGAYHFCPNHLGCPAQLKGAILHYVSRPAMDIEGLGERKISQLMREKLLTSVPDIYQLPAHEAQITALPDWGDLSFSNLVKAIEASRGRPLAAFILALGIEGVGQTTAGLLLEHFHSWRAFSQASEAELKDVPNIGPIVAASISRFFLNPHTAQLAVTLYNEARPMESEPMGDNSWHNENVVFTGGLASLSRDEAAEMVRARGGKVGGSVGKSTSLVVAGQQAGSKLDKAVKLGLNIIDEQEFLRRIKDGAK